MILQATTLLLTAVILPANALVVPTRPVNSFAIAAPVEEPSLPSWMELGRGLLESMFVTSNKPATETRIQLFPWCGEKYYSDLIREGINYLERADDIVMVFESPSASSTCGTSFCNEDKFKFLDYPLPRPPVLGRTILGPLRYAAMSGASYPTFLHAAPPPKLIEHWCKTIPNFSIPKFVHKIPSSSTVCAFLPLESLENRHLIDPVLHFKVAGKDAIPKMTSHTTRMLPNTRPESRPCVAKISQSMGSRGIFVIRDDADEVEFENFWRNANYPEYVITACVDIGRNLACHFFIHPWGDITWFGSSENEPDGSGGWSGDSTMRMADQDNLRTLLTPYCLDVAKYCSAQGYWGACGIDVLLDRQGKGYVVDVNPRVTGTGPALMIFQKLREKGRDWKYGIFRRSSTHFFPGSVDQVLAEVDAFNASCDDCEVFILSLCKKNSRSTRLNIAVYGNHEDECRLVLNRFAALPQYK